MTKENQLPQLPVETNEFVDALVNTAVQAVVSFADGAGPDDVPDFIDEVLSWPRAVDGLKNGFPNEAKTVTPELVEQMFNQQQQKLVAAGIQPMLAGAMVTGAKSIYYAYCTVIQNGQPVVMPTIKKNVA